MKRVALLSVLFVVCFSAAFAGGSTGPGNDRSVMIIPFSPDMYFSDADESLAKHNDRNIKEIRTMFRYGLNINMNARILTEYKTTPLLSAGEDGAAEDLYRIYNSISYFEDDAMGREVPDDVTKAPKSKGKWSFGKNNSDGQSDQSANAAEPEGAGKYINVKIHSNKMLDYLHEKYGTELFVFVNQFNLVTDFEHCLDRTTNTFAREFLVHFSIFDYTGKQLAGDVARVYYDSNSNDMMDLMKANFPVITNYLANQLPPKVSLPFEADAGYEYYMEKPEAEEPAETEEPVPAPTASQRRAKRLETVTSPEPVKEEESVAETATTDSPKEVKRVEPEVAEAVTSPEPEVKTYREEIRRVEQQPEPVQEEKVKEEEKVLEEKGGAEEDGIEYMEFDEPEEEE